jgi:GntR family transcriptional regulator
MSTLFGVSRITVRQAMSELQREGVIFKVPGKGTFVSHSKAYQHLAYLEGFGKAMSRLGHQIRNTVIAHKTVAASRAVAQQLRLEEGNLVSEITRVRHLDGVPVSLEVSYRPEAVGDRLRSEDLARRDIFVIIEDDYGIGLGHADFQIDAIPAYKELSHALHVANGSALLRLQRLTFTAEGRPLDFEYLYFRSDIFQYRMRLARRPTSGPTLVR